MKILGKLSIKDGRLVWEIDKEARQIEEVNEIVCETAKEDSK